MDPILLTLILMNEPSITVIDFFNQPTDNIDNVICTVAASLKSNTHVTRIDLCNTRITDVGAIAIADLLKINTTIRSINLEYNYICDNGARAIADSLKINTGLSELYLGNNGVGDIGLKYLAKALMYNKTLTKLWMEENPITIRGVQFFIDALEHSASCAVLGCHTLFDLRLENENIYKNYEWERIQNTIKDSKRFTNEYGLLALEAGLDSGLIKVSKQHLGLRKSLLVHIISSIMPISDVETCRLVCKAWRTIANDVVSNSKMLSFDKTSNKTRSKLRSSWG